MIFDIGVIETFTIPYPRNNPVRYYVKYWEEKFSDRISEYYWKNKIDSSDRRKRIHVFFDKYTVLKITQCYDDKLYNDIKQYVVNRYKWELRNNSSISRDMYNVYELLNPYVRVSENGYIIISYEGLNAVIPKEQYGGIGRMYVDCYHTYRSTVIEFDSGVRDINDIIYKIIKNNDVKREEESDEYSQLSLMKW